MSKVLVTGATGNVGPHVVAALRKRGASVRALVRDPGKARTKLGEGVELTVGDFDDPASLRRAMQGVETVFLTSADGPRKVAHETAVIDAAAAHWVRRVVKLSSPHVEVGSDLAFWDWHGQIERYLEQAPVPAVYLRANFLMSGLLASADAVRSTGRLFAPAEDAKIAMLDPYDIGAVAAIVLTEDRHDGKAYRLTGPEAITFRQVAEHLSAATGRDIGFVDVPLSAARTAMLESGMPDWLADALVTLFGKLRGGACGEVNDTVYDLTGHLPRSFAEWAAEHAAAFAG